MKEGTGSELTKEAGNAFFIRQDRQSRSFRGQVFSFTWWVSLDFFFFLINTSLGLSAPIYKIDNTSVLFISIKEMIESLFIELG